MASKRDHAIRARAFVEAAKVLLHLANFETIDAEDRDNTRAITSVMQDAERLLERLDHLIQVSR